MTRREFAGAAAALVQRATGRSVLLLIGDDHSPVLGCYGNKVVQTPNLDALAARGIRFTNAFCTTASCSASRSVILTGLHNHTNGQYGHAHDFHHFHTRDWVQSLPRLARAAGAATGVIAKLHVLPESVYNFEHVYGGGRDGWGIARHAADFLKKAGGRPFYLHVGFNDPHRGGDPTRFGNHVSYPNVKKVTCSPADVEVPPFLPDLPEVRKELAEHYQAINRMDQGIGFVLEALEKSGRAKDTLVLYLGDNGMPFPTAKASLYDAGLRVPLIMAGASSGVNDALVHTPDIAPTAIEWMGLTPPKYPLHGRSLLGPLQRSEIYFSHTFHEINNYYPFRGVHTDRWKYVRVLYPELEMPLPTDLFASPTWQAIRERSRHRLKHDAEELYDLQTDPLETRNVAAQQPEVLADLRARTQRFRKETSDGWLVVDQQMEGRF